MKKISLPKTKILRGLFKTVALTTCMAVLPGCTVTKIIYNITSSARDSLVAFEDKAFAGKVAGERASDAFAERIAASLNCTDRDEDGNPLCAGGLLRINKRKDVSPLGDDVELVRPLYMRTGRSSGARFESYRNDY